ncbi:hypothetical protein [Micromonospora sp. CPCC 205558]|uniref:hypothetical protein n=1 Tax=Micromonospora sp. CPCC 205558 TaxID=3122403 RepID=UPI002FF420E2
MNVDELGSMLEISAHPDDEAYLSDGLIRRPYERLSIGSARRRDSHVAAGRLNLPREQTSNNIVGLATRF